MAHFRPSLMLTVFTAVALSVLIGLGTWQARKVGPKSARIAAIKAGFDKPAIDLPLKDAGTYDYRHIVFQGAVIPHSPIRHYLTNLNGRPGYHLYQAVKVAEGPVVFVNLGWIPVDHDISTLSLPVGRVTFHGYLRASAKAAPMQATNNPAQNQWYVANVDEMASYLKGQGFDIPSVYNMRVILDDDQQQALPQKGQMYVKIPNKHKEYAFTWFGIAGALIAVYIGFGLQRGREFNGKASGS